MIRVRAATYLPRAMHGTAEVTPSGTVVRLLPQMTSQHRHEVLRRLYWEGQRGIGPCLPVIQLAAAVIVWRAGQWLWLLPARLIPGPRSGWLR